MSILNRKNTNSKLILCECLTLNKTRLVTKDFCLQSLGWRTWMNIASRTSWIPTPYQSNLIYLFECWHCKSRYLGKTSQRFGERIKQHIPKHLVDAPTSKKRRSRPPKVWKKPAEGYQSAIACHLAANEDCHKSFPESDFSILCRCRLKHHQDVLEATFIHVLRPKLCKQNSLQVFQPEAPKDNKHTNCGQRAERRTMHWHQLPQHNNQNT